jgi:hypothetical protein
MITFEMLDPRMTVDMLGIIPSFISVMDPRPLTQQLDDAYAHGGGWRPFEGFTMAPDGSIKYPGDPAHKPLAKAQVRDETLYYYDYSWVSVVQADGSYEVCRMD